MYKTKIDLISTQELNEKLNLNNLQILDLRSVDLYNGYNDLLGHRRGHIKGARSFPCTWFLNKNWPEILNEKGINHSYIIVLYGCDLEKMIFVSNKLINSGFKDVYIYNNFFEEWITNEYYPMDYLLRYKQLMSAKGLKSILDNKNNLKIFHVYYDNNEDYKIGHIPGAFKLDVSLLESPITWNRREPKELETNLTNLGITWDTTVVLYGRTSNFDKDDPNPGTHTGQISAYRSALILLYAGVKDVRILNGGLKSWEDEGFFLDTDLVPLVPVFEFGMVIPGNPEYIVDMEEAKSIVDSNDQNLICVRSYPEFIGEVSGYSYISKKGRIPSSIFSDCGSDAYHMDNYRNFDNTTKEYNDIKNNWRVAGITSNVRNTFYCGTGWKASEAWFNAWLMGWENISVYDGGWFEWSSYDNNPFETGVPNIQLV